MGGQKLNADPVNPKRRSSTLLVPCFHGFGKTLKIAMVAPCTGNFFNKDALKALPFGVTSLHALPVSNFWPRFSR
jgi:hypothetical protein